jgi:L-arabinose isomerase
MRKTYVINLPCTNYYLDLHNDGRKDSFSWACGAANTTHFSSRENAEKALKDSEIEGLEIIEVDSYGDTA